MPWPPPMQADPTALFSFLRRNSCTKCPVILAPEAARGCPSAIAPPLTLSLFWSSFRASAQARVWTPKASLICKKNSPIFELTLLLGKSPQRTNLNEIDIIERKSSNFENILNSWNWTNSHNFWSNTNSRICYKTSQWLQIVLPDSIFRSNNYRSSTIANSLQRKVPTFAKYFKEEMQITVNKSILHSLKPIQPLRRHLF